MENKLLLDIARKSINQKFDSSLLIDTAYFYKEFPNLEKKGASFVTITLDGKLRGCIGSLVAYRSLLEDIISNSYSAAFNDPRFYELSKGEFERIDIEISILSEPKILEYIDLEDLKAKIKPNIHGVILQKNGRKATFLPQVWEQLSTFEEFFSNLCLKAGLEGNCYENNPEIFTYEAKKIK